MAVAALAEGGGGLSSSSIQLAEVVPGVEVIASGAVRRNVVDRFLRCRKNSSGSYGGQRCVRPRFVIMMNAPLLVAHISVTVTVFRLDVLY
jgi:hypothetical protein